MCRMEAIENFGRMCRCRAGFATGRLAGLMTLVTVISLVGCGGEPRGPVPPPPPPDDTPPVVGGELVVTGIEECYPKGMTQRAVSIIKIGGRASQADWGLKGVNNFAYRYRVVSELKVTESTANRIRFRKKILDVHQVNAVSKRTLELSLPSDPIIAGVFEEAERIFAMPLIPGYPAGKLLAEFIRSIDPNLKGTLTAISKEFGLNPMSDEVQLLVNDLSGRTFDIVWIKGIGVDTEISEEISKEGREPLDDRQLTRFFESVGLLTDFLLLDGKPRKIGDVWSIDARDVREVLQFGMDYDVKGKLKVKRVEDKVVGKTALIEVVGGDLEVSTVDEENDQKGSVRVIGGQLEWSITDKMIIRGRFEMDGDTLVMSRNHLLFKAMVASVLASKAYYESEKIGPKGEN